MALSEEGFCLKKTYLGKKQSGACTRKATKCICKGLQQVPLSFFNKKIKIKMRNPFFPEHHQQQRSGYLQDNKDQNINTNIKTISKRSLGKGKILTAYCIRISKVRQKTILRHCQSISHIPAVRKGTIIILKNSLAFSDFSFPYIITTHRRHISHKFVFRH